MNKERREAQVFSRKHVEGNVEQGTDTEAQIASQPSLSESRHTKKAPVEDSSEEENDQSKEAAGDPGGDPPVDWFEPLEEDNDDDDGNSACNDPEDESLAGESEMSESIAGSEKAFKKTNQFPAVRSRRSRRDEGWVECPELGEGWKRREVIRRSGCSVGQTDTYYLGPKGDRVRSKVELLSVLQGVLDLSNFDFKSGKFYDRDTPPIRVRNRLKKKVRERSSSESSFMERGDGADTPDSNHRLTPSGFSLNKQTSYSSSTRVGTPNQVSREKDPTEEETIRLPVPSSFRLRPLPSINGDIGTEDSTLVCARCSASFTGTWYDKQRKRPCCPSCWASKTKEHPMSRFRKWIPCGQCVGCANTVDCGQCANCKHGLQSPESRRRVCRKRKCICPIRKSPGSISFLQSTYNDTPETFDDTCMSFQSEVTDSQLPSVKSSDNDNVNMDVDDDDDFSTDDDDDWHKKRKRRSCGECQACLCRKDCGTCDFCVDKPKFGGSNKKRQKCRLRQCQRQAMRHLLPFQMGQGDCSLDGSLLPGRPRPHYTYSRKPNQIKKNKGPHFNLDFTDNEDDDGYFQEMNWISEPATGSKHSHEPSMRDQQAHFIQQNGLSDRAPYTGNHNNSQPDQQSKWDAESSHPNRNVENHVEQEAEEEENDDEELPMITQIFSLADQSAGSGVDVESQLMKLLQTLRTSVLPILWYAIMVEGPQLQLLQCCKKSSMIDTMVLIDPGFCYQVTVQKQPLLPTHPLYDSFPARLTSANEVVNLLLGLEKYVVCQGLSPRDPHSKSPVILERASTCDFLVDRTVSVCSNCRALQVI